jgi:hypothetical protein
MSIVPVTRCVTAVWDRPRYELLDARGAVLAALSQVSEIAGFAPLQDKLNVNFANGRHVTVDLPQAGTVDPVDSSFAESRPYIEAVGAALGASRALMRVSVQHLVEWTDQQDAEAAQLVAGAAAVGVPGVTDFAVLIDGRHGDDWTYQAEFGVVAAAEVPDRITRHIGRALGPRMKFAADESAFAPVSTFVDSNWKLQRFVDVSSDECWDLIADVDEHAATLVSELHTRLVSQQKGEARRDGA